MFGLMRFSSCSMLSTCYYFGEEEKGGQVSSDAWIMLENDCLWRLNYLPGGWLLAVSMNNCGI